MTKDWNNFYQVVIQDRAIKDQLKGATDRASFVKLAVKLGEEKGYSFTAGDVEAAIADVEATMRPKAEMNCGKVAQTAPLSISMVIALLRSKSSALLPHSLLAR